MPDVSVQTDDFLGCSQCRLRECTIQSLAITIKQGWKNMSAMTFVADTSFCEDIYFIGYPPGYHFTASEWETIQKKYDEFLVNGIYPNYSVSDEQELKYILQDLTWTSLGFPIHIVELVYTEGLLVRNDVKHYDLRIPLNLNGNIKTAQNIVIEDIRDALFDTHLKNQEGYHYRALRFKALQTRDGEFRDFSGSPMQGLSQRSLETYLHLNSMDDSVPFVCDDGEHINPYTNNPYQTLQLVLDDEYEPSEEDDEYEPSEEDEEGESDSDESISERAIRVYG